MNLTGTKSLKEAQERLAAYAEGHPDEPWIIGRGWNEIVWKLGRLPTAADIDSVVDDRPVWLVRVDGHAGVANTKALKVVGITADTPDPDGGRIVHDGAGNPTGLLIDAAQDLVEKKLPEPTLEDVRARALAAQKQLGCVRNAGRGVEPGRAAGRLRLLGSSGAPRRASERAPRPVVPDFVAGQTGPVASRGPAGLP